MSTKRTRRLFSLLVATAIVVTSCGGGDSDPSSSGNRQRNAALTQRIRQMRTKVRYFTRSSMGYNLAISNEDELVMWGNPTYDMAGVLNPPVGTARVASIGGTQAVAIDLNNQFHAWGDVTDKLRNVPAGIDLSKVTSLMVNGGAVIAVDSDGKVWGWGDVWDAMPEEIPEIVNQSKIVEAITYNAQFNAALDDTGKVHVWGYNQFVSAAQKALDGIKAKHIALRDMTLSVVTTDGRIVETGWGPQSDLFRGVDVEVVSGDMFGNFLAADTAGRLHLRLGNREFTDLSSQVDNYNQYWSENGPKAVSIAPGVAHFTVLFDDGEFWDFAQFFEKGMTVPDYFYSSNSVSSIAAGNFRSYAIRDNYSITNFHTLMEGESAPPDDADFLAVAAGWDHALGLRRNGMVVSWGQGPNNNEIPEGLEQVRQIGAGNGFSAVRDIYGQISSWGSFQSSSASKKQPDGYFYYTNMSTGFHNIIAIGNDGVSDTSVIHVWGDNSYGQADVPSDIDANQVEDISIGFDCAAATLSDGSVRLWGQCVANETNVPIDQKFNTVKLGAGFAVGVTWFGDVVVWGDNSAELGATPSNLRNIVDVSVGNRHVLAVDGDGGVYGWGPNVWGETNIPEDFKPLPMDDIYDENYDDNLSDEQENLDAQVEGAKNPIPTPTIVDDTPIFVVNNGQLVSETPKAPEVPPVESILETKPITMTSLPATLNPVTKTGKVVKVADAVKLLRLKKITKAAFVVPRQVTTANAKVCSITKTAVTITGTGICDVKLSYVDSKKKKRTKALPLIAAP